MVRVAERSVRSNDAPVWRLVDSTWVLPLRNLMMRVSMGALPLAIAACGPTTTNDDAAARRDAAICDGAPCRVGEREERPGDRCAREERTCTDGCTWTDWSQAVAPGECAVGDTRSSASACSSGLTRSEICAADCTWSATSACVDACGDHAANTEICISAGRFLRGRGFSPPTGPAAELGLRAFYLDRYPATNADYQACITAGTCTTPLDSDGARSLTDSTRAHYPVQGLSWIQATAYCNWRARRLPSEAEWEKAARGPYPRMGDYPWGDTPATCVSFPSTGCTPPAGHEPSLAADEVDAWPFADSYYGAALMLGGVHEWTSDHWDELYYQSPSSGLDDPHGPAGGSERSVRGAPRYYTDPSVDFTVSGRFGAPEDAALPFGGARCARSAP
jgi:sulfatase modifying factor 1